MAAALRKLHEDIRVWRLQRARDQDMAQPCPGCPHCCGGHRTSVFTPGMGQVLFPSHLQGSGQLDKAAQPHLLMSLGPGHPSRLKPLDHTLGTWETPGALTLQLSPLVATSCHICSRPHSAVKAHQGTRKSKASTSFLKYKGVGVMLLLLIHLQSWKVAPRRLGP